MHGTCGRRMVGTCLPVLFILEGCFPLVSRSGSVPQPEVRTPARPVPAIAPSVVTASVAVPIRWIRDTVEVRIGRAAIDAHANGAHAWAQPIPNDPRIQTRHALARDPFTYVPTGPSAPIATPITFDVSGYEVIEHRTSEARAVFAPLAATDLVQLDGLSSGRLFVWNVRQSLGRTKVNKEIAASINQPAEHKNFLLYHNGLTILCESITIESDRITIAGYNAVNGCQSLTSLYENRASVSADLRLLARLVELAPDSDLAGKITHHSNNQNAINARDLQSNSAIQRRLQNEFLAKYGGKVFYKIKRGETAAAHAILENEDVAKVLLAFDVEQPWSCHQSYKLFDELHAEIFARPEVNAERILALAIVFEEVVVATGQLNNRLMANYSLTQYALLYLLKQALEEDEAGRDFVRNPGKYLSAPNGSDRLRSCVRKIIGDLVVDLNAELQEREEAGKPIDYKRELKSITAVKKLARDIIPAYQKAVKRNRAAAFGEEWEASAIGR